MANSYDLLLFYPTLDWAVALVNGEGEVSMGNSCWLEGRYPSQEHNEISPVLLFKLYISFIFIKNISLQVKGLKMHFDTLQV